MHVMVSRLARREGSEPPKPPHTVLWPNGVDESHPDVTRAGLPMNLSKIVDRFEAMRTASEAVGGQFAVSSPVRMVRDGLTLNLPDDQVLYNSLGTYYPLSYAEVQRLSDFHRRVFRAYADKHGLLYVDSAAYYPLDPLLFADSVHMTPAGLRLKAWIDFQRLVPWLEREIGRGALPRPMRHPGGTHPNLSSVDYPLVSKSEILARCQ
jgi:hypothetical protein